MAVKKEDGSLNVADFSNALKEGIAQGVQSVFELQEQRAKDEAARLELQKKEEDKELALKAEAETYVFTPVTLVDIDSQNPLAKAGRVENYTVKPGEETAVHAEIEGINFDRNGNKTSKPVIKQWNDVTWLRFLENLPALNINYVRVLHAPEGWKLRPTPKAK